MTLNPRAPKRQLALVAALLLILVLTLTAFRPELFDAIVYVYAHVWAAAQFVVNKIVALWTWIE